MAARSDLKIYAPKPQVHVVMEFVNVQTFVLLQPSWRHAWFTARYLESVRDAIDRELSTWAKGFVRWVGKHQEGASQFLGDQGVRLFHVFGIRSLYFNGETIYLIRRNFRAIGLFAFSQFFLSRENLISREKKVAYLLVFKLRRKP